MWFEFASAHVVVLTWFTKNDFCLVATFWTLSFAPLVYPPPKRITAPSPKRLTVVRNSQENPPSELLKNAYKWDNSSDKKAIIHVFVPGLWLYQAVWSHWQSSHQDISTPSSISLWKYPSRMESWSLVCRTPAEVNTSSFLTPPQKVRRKVGALITRSLPLETSVVFPKTICPYFTAYRRLPKASVIQVPCRLETLLNDLKNVRWLFGHQG